MKHPTDPKAIFPEIISDYQKCFGKELISIILYGSATGPDYRPGTSDINFMIVLSDRGIEALERALGIVKKWRKRRVATPLFLTETYVETSTDTFPIEYLNFLQSHALVFGKDILSELVFKPQFIRLQCEREIKAKLLLLRQAFLETDGKEKSLKALIGQSLSAFLAIFEALLYLKRVESGRGKREAIRATAETFGVDAGVFERLLDVKEKRTVPQGDEMRQLFRDYLREVRQLSRRVDLLGGEDE